MSSNFLYFLALPWLALSTQPNVVFIVIDDLGWTDTSYNKAEYATPGLDALAQSGVRLTNYYVQSTCSPTRTSFMTGRYPFRVGLQDPATIPPGATAAIPMNVPTMAELFKKQGYKTQMFGKWHLGYANWANTPTGRGFDNFLGYFQGAGDYYHHDIANGYDFWLDRNVLKAANGTYSNFIFREGIEKFLQNSNSGEPFFLYASFQTVHAPIEYPPSGSSVRLSECDKIKDDLRKWYCQKMVVVDDTVTDIVATLKNTSLYDNTLIVMTTDNGGMPHWNSKQQNISITVGCGSNYPFRAGKATWFEGGVRGNAIVAGGILPKMRAGTTSNGLMHASDWLPTLLTATGNTGVIPSGIDGMNLWSSILGGKSPRTEVILNIWDNGRTQSGILQNGMKLIVGQQIYDGYYPAPPAAVIPANNEGQGEYLFNVTADPYEKNDLSKTMRPEVVRLRAEIARIVQQGNFLPAQSYRQHAAAQPQLHGGVWAPWLG